MDPASPDKKLIRVTIFQQPYTLRSSGEPGETEALAQRVDDLMNQIATRTNAGDPVRVAVLSSLHLADRVRTLERELDALLGRIADLDKKLSDVLPTQDDLG